MLRSKGKHISSLRELRRGFISLGRLPFHVMVDLLAYKPDASCGQLFAGISVTSLIDGHPEGTLDAG